LTGERKWLLARLAEKPDLTLRVVMAEFLHASEQDRADFAQRRARWKMHQSRLDPRRHGRCRTAM
jgi:hypothetical protein